MGAKSKEKNRIREDLIENSVHEVEHMGREEAYDAVPVLLGSVDESYFKLGLILDHIKSNQWWAKGDTFRNVVEGTFGIKYRKAMYLIGISDNLVEANVPWSKVKSLGWTKLKEVSDILTPENVDEWVDKAGAVSTLELKELVKAAKQDSLEPSDLPDVTDTVSTLTFKLHKDQRDQIVAALEQGKLEAETEYSSVALESICSGYLAGSVSTGDDDAVTKLQEELDTHIQREKELEKKLKKSKKAEAPDLEALVRELSDDPIEALSGVLEVFDTIWPDFTAKVVV